MTKGNKWYKVHGFNVSFSILSFSQGSPEPSLMDKGESFTFFLLCLKILLIIKLQSHENYQFQNEMGFECSPVRTAAKCGGYE